jgi:hypothetical protein
MKAAFTTQNFLSENRALVIEGYNKAASSEFFNQISLKDFMVQVLNTMNNNNPKSEKRAASLLPHIVSMAIVSNTKIDATDKVTDSLRNKYNGTSYMAMV